MFDFLSMGSQPYGTCIPPNQNNTPLHTPKSKLYPLYVPPNQKFYPNKLFWVVVFLHVAGIELHLRKKIFNGIYKFRIFFVLTKVAYQNKNILKKYLFLNKVSNLTYWTIIFENQKNCFKFIYIKLSWTIDHT